jgi:hypothetical protein
LSQLSFKDILIIIRRKNLFIPLCRTNFPSGIIFLLPEGFPLTFLALQVCWWRIFSTFTCLMEVLLDAIFYLWVGLLSTNLYSLIVCWCAKWKRVMQERANIRYNQVHVISLGTKGQSSEQRLTSNKIVEISL